ncbi:hypothetical protein LPU83_pLPU83b_0518 (plasmid) [Rhizobium favelukesii]|uniref:Uncharacterized protein n=1 Tax=Rhizobium favelukesii TaxID=348824 RepID=W6RI33_9HYPH|nr:hypothetical protein LPU83_pLPU83b_0518 [Rhizobium favelukesii]
MCLELASRKPSWPVVMCGHTQRPHIWKQAIRSKLSLVVPDNLKSGVNHASFYDPEISRKLRHDGLPTTAWAFVRHGQESLGVNRKLKRSPFCPDLHSGRLRKQTIFSLAEANAAIGQALDRLNDYLMRRLGVTRRQVFDVPRCACGGSGALPKT